MKAVKIILACIIIYFLASCPLYSYFGYYNQYKQHKQSTEKVVQELKQVLSYIEKHRPNFSQEIKLKLIHTIDSLSLLSLPTWTNMKHKIRTPAPEFHPDIENTSIFYSCPETFLHAKFGHPYFMYGSWIIANCTQSTPISQILSILLFAPDDKTSCTGHLRNTVEGIPRSISGYTSFNQRLHHSQMSIQQFTRDPV
uniref:Uncharacterized protein n=1 Tax=Strigamia maritima TaxID=126957 RepID=T1JPC4_STRMM